MAGALMQLVAYGAQDVYLTSQPEITFFKAVYRRHTNFAMESMKQTLHGCPGFGSHVVCKVARNGDLIGRTWVKHIIKTDTYTDVLVGRVGFALLKNVELRIGGQLIDKQSGQWMLLWTELSHTNAQKTMLDYLVGPITGTANTTGSDNTVQEHTVYVPLQFSFCRNPGLYLPLIALQYHDVELHIDFASRSDIVKVDTNSGVTLGNCEIWIDYIFLDTEERKSFAKNPHEYLIETVQTQSSLAVNGQNSIRLNFNHPVKELVWVATLSSVEDDLGDKFTTFVPGNNSDFTDGVSILNNTVLKLNGQERFCVRDFRYFQYIVPHQFHTGNPLDGINCYSFAIRPEEHQPSGTCNFSRIDNATLDFTNDGQDSYDTNQSATVTIHALAYNVLRVASGMGGLAYAN